MKGTSQLMTSDATSHVAEWSPDAAADGGGAWVVSWLPQRLLTEDQAVTAMMIAEQVAKGLPPGDRVWLHVDNWARELGLTRSEVVARVGVPA
jgi:hypothetical protein